LFALFVAASISAKAFAIAADSDVAGFTLVSAFTTVSPVEAHAA
jgi:hypothetical protein